MSQYLILIHSDERRSEGMTEQDDAALYEAHVKFSNDNEKAIVGGQALMPTSTATSIRSDGAGGFVVTDGPFAETKEALGGYYLVEAADLDEAIAIAKQVPAPNGGVELRPIQVFE